MVTTNRYMQHLSGRSEKNLYKKIIPRRNRDAEKRPNKNISPQRNRDTEKTPELEKVLSKKPLRLRASAVILFICTSTAAVG